MRKFYVSNVEELNDQEKKTGCVSYQRLIKRYISDLVLCNEITSIDETIWEYMSNYNEEIYQFYLCDLTEYEKQELIEYGVILSYSHKLELDILCVDHYGTAWDYVMTEVEWTTDINE